MLRRVQTEVGGVLKEQTRRASVPRRVMGTGRNGNVRYLVNQMRLQVPESRGLQKPYDAFDANFDDVSATEVMDGRIVGTGTDDEFEKFPWSQYSATIAATVVLSISTVLLLFFCNSQRGTIRELRQRTKAQEAKNKKALELARSLDVQVAAYKALVEERTAQLSALQMKKQA